MYLIDSTGKIYFLRETMSYQLVRCLEVVLLWLQLKPILKYQFNV